jgi:hypothetical protein
MNDKEEMARITIVLNRDGGIDCKYAHSMLPEAAVVMHLGMLEVAKAHLMIQVSKSTSTEAEK